MQIVDCHQAISIRVLKLSMSAIIELLTTHEDNLDFLRRLPRVINYIVDEFYYP